MCSVALIILRKLSAIAIIVGVVVFVTPANALDEIYSPAAEPKELSFEYNGSRTFDGSSVDKNNSQEHELAVEYGFNDWFTGEVSGGFAKEPTDHIRLSDIEVEGRFQFTQPGEYWIDSGLLLAYDFSTMNEVANSLEAKLLLQKDTGMITTTANIGFETDVGHYAASGGPDYVLLANSRYRINPYFQPGIEVQSDFGQAHTIGKFDQQEHYMGVAAYGTLFGRLKYQAAYLFGLTDASSESSARLLLEYETHF